MFANEVFDLDDVDGFSWLSIFIAANSPDWFVSDNNFIDIFGADFMEAAGELTID